MNPSHTPMRQLSRSLVLLMCAGTLAFAGCSGSSSGGPAAGTAVDLQGIWKIWATETGQVEAGPAVLFLSVTGATISGAVVSGTANGSSFEFTSNVQNGIATAQGTLSTTTNGAGTYVTTKTDGTKVTGTFRMEKFSPAGFLSVRGAVLGQTVTHQSSKAVGIRKYLDPAHTQLIECELVTGSVGLSFELDFAPKNLAVGRLTAGLGPQDVAVAVEFSTGSVSARALAVSGTIDVTTYDATSFVGTFTLNLDTGDTVTGIIDVKFDIDALHPFGA